MWNRCWRACEDRVPDMRGMMVWTAPDGIIGAKLVVLIRNSKGDRP